MEKGPGGLNTRRVQYKKPVEVTPKISTPQMFAKSGVRSISVLFMEKTPDHVFSLREMEYDLDFGDAEQRVKAHSLYFEISDNEASVYLQANFVPTGTGKALVFLAINVSPADPEKTDLFALPVVTPEYGDLATLIGDLDAVLGNLIQNSTGKRNYIYGKMRALTAKLTEVYQANTSRLTPILGLTYKPMITLMDFDFACCLDSVAELIDCIYESPEVTDICEICGTIYDCFIGCISIITTPECLTCLAITVVACATCALEAKMCVDAAYKVLNCC